MHPRKATVRHLAIVSVSWSRASLGLIGWCLFYQVTAVVGGKLGTLDSLAALTLLVRSLLEGVLYHCVTG